MNCKPLGVFLPLLVLALALAGCTIRPLAARATAAAMAGAAKTLAASSTQPGGPSPESNQRRATTGFLRMSIAWPVRSIRGFRAQTIPLSTNTLLFQVSSGGKALASAKLARGAADLTSSCNLELPVANNLSLEVRAYRDQDPDWGSSVAIATGSVAGINILSSKTTAVDIPLGPAFYPRITGLSAPVAQPGESITIYGQNLGPVGGAGPGVSLGGVPLAVTATAQGAITATLPSNAAVGELEVKSDGLSSRDVSGAYLWVADQVTIDAPKATWDASGPGSREVIADHWLTLSASCRFRYAPNESLATYLARGLQPPNPVWLPLVRVGTVDNAGNFQATESYASETATATLGSLSSNSLNLIAENVSLSLSPSDATLQAAGDAPLHFTAINTLSDGSTNSLVSFGSSDPNGLWVSKSGLTFPGGSAHGQFTVTATSQLASQSAVARVQLNNFKVDTVARSLDLPIASFSYPSQVAVDPVGNIYVSDGSNSSGTLIRKITCDGQVVSIAGVNSNYGYNRSVDGSGNAASFAAIEGLAIDPSGRLLVADSQSIRRLGPDNVVSTLADKAQLAWTANDIGLGQIAIDATGDVFVAGEGSIRKIDASGSVSILAHLSTYDYPILAVDQNGRVFAAWRGAIYLVQPDGTSALYAGSASSQTFAEGTRTTARFSGISGLAVDSAGNLFVSDSGNNAIRVIRADGTVTTLAGQGTAGFVDGMGTAAQFNSPGGIAIDTTGNLYVADKLNYAVREVRPNGMVTTLAGAPWAQGVQDGLIYGGGLISPVGLAVDGAGNVMVADNGARSVFVISPQGSKVTQNFDFGLLSSPVYCTDQKVPYVCDSTGPLSVALGPGGAYAAIGKGGTPDFVERVALDGTKTKMVLSGALAVVSDAAGNLFISTGNTLWKKLPNGGATILAGSTTGQAGYADGKGTAASFNLALGLAVDANGNLFIADANNNRIRKVAPDGTATTLAGSGKADSTDGPGLQAAFSRPTGLAVDARGNLLVADSGNDEIRLVSATGQVATAAGYPSDDNSDGVGSNAGFRNPTAIAIDLASGRIYVADTGNRTVRSLVPVQ